MLAWLKRLFSRPMLAAVPCPYCSNPDRDFWIYDKNNSSRACKFDVPAHGGSDPPCVCDHYGTLRGY